MTGTKTSVWLGEDLAARWKASGLSLTQIVRLGLDAADAQASAAGEDRPVTREELAAAEDRIVRRVRDDMERIADR